jgi:hypothetical protein
MTAPDPQELVAAIHDAYEAIVNPPAYDGPACHCGSQQFIQHGGGRGFECHRGHRLPGQDLPRRTPLPGADPTPIPHNDKTTPIKVTFELCPHCWRPINQHKQAGTFGELNIYSCDAAPRI